MNVAKKNVENGMRKCPQVIPAKSKRGLGICDFRQIAYEIGLKLI